MSGGFVEADGFRIRYLDAGQGDVLVHLHGAGGPRPSDALDLLAERRRVVRFEMPGFGQSGPNERTKALPELAETMAAAAAALGLEHYDLIGNSFGATVALWLASAHADRLVSLVLASPAAIRDVDAPPPPEARPGSLVARLTGLPRDPELETRLRELEIPTLVVMGTEDQHLRPELGRHYVELMPKAHLVYVYGAGHLVDADRPEAFATLVADFLERREEFLVTNRSGVLFP